MQRDLTNLSGILSRPLRRGWIDTNPYLEAQKVKYVASGDLNVLTVRKLEAVAPTAKFSAFAALFRVTAYTGLRFGELGALRWRSLDFLNAAVHVRRNFPGTRPEGRRGGEGLGVHRGAARTVSRTSLFDPHSAQLTHAA